MSCQKSHQLQKNFRTILALVLLENLLQCIDLRVYEIVIDLDQIEELEINRIFLICVIYICYNLRVNKVPYAVSTVRGHPDTT